MSEHCFYRLKINTAGALNPSWKMPQHNGQYGIWSPPAEKIFSKEWLEYTGALGIDFHHALLFYRGPYATSKEAHVDTHAEDHKFVRFAVNWVIGGDESEMHWYKMPDMSAASTVKDPKTNVPYTTFQFRDLELLESCKIADEVTIVKTDLPHSVTMGKEPRWCISARLQYGNEPTWEEMLGYLRQKNLLVEHE